MSACFGACVWRVCVWRVCVACSTTRGGQSHFSKVSEKTVPRNSVTHVIVFFFPFGLWFSTGSNGNGWMCREAAERVDRIARFIRGTH